MSQKKIFRPVLAVPSAVPTTELSANTPCGLFLANSGNRYLVFDDGKRRSALALVHSELDPFTAIKLKKRHLETGTWLGLGYIRLDRFADYESKAMYTGMLYIMNGAASILITDGRERFALKPVAEGEGGVEKWAYDRWTLFAQGGLEFFRFRAGKHPPFILFD